VRLPQIDPEDIPTRAQLARENAEPPIPVARRNGHMAVARYVSPPEPLVHLAGDGYTTLCGLPWEMRVATSPWPTCAACIGRVDDDERGAA
jgi:hypothetical protein